MTNRGLRLGYGETELRVAMYGPRLRLPLRWV